MDDMPQFPWFNIHDIDHDHGHQEQQNFDFDSDDIFLNPIHQLSPTNWANQAIAYADLVCNNGFLDIKNSIPTTTTSMASLECLLSCTNSSIDDSSDGMPVVFSDDKTLWRNDDIVTRNNNVSGVSSGDSVTDDGVLSQSLQQINQIECSSGSKRPIERVGVSENQPRPKRSRSDPGQPTSSTINFQQPGNPSETDTEAIAQMKEMIYREAAFRPVSFAAETVVDKPKRKNVRISSDPQTVAARERRERISERIRVLQKLVPGGNKMDTASMLDEAANYLKFLRSQVKALEQVGQNSTPIIPQYSSMVAPFIQNIFSMQPHFQYPHENLYPNPPPA